MQLKSLLFGLCVCVADEHFRQKQVGGKKNLTTPKATLFKLTVDPFSICMRLTIYFI